MAAKHYNSRQIRGYIPHLRKALQHSYEHPHGYAVCEINTSVISACIDILNQAMKTEINHEPPRRMKRELDNGTRPI